MFEDQSPLWPEKDGSAFPHRVRISPPIAEGNVPLELAQRNISFMRDKDVPTGTIQGANGVFNAKLTDVDLNFLLSGMRRDVRLRPEPDPSRVRAVSQRQDALFRFYERDVEDRIESLLPAMGLELYRDPDGRPGRQFICQAGRIDLLCRSVTDRSFVVLELKKGLAPNEVLLQILRYMSWVRQHMAGPHDVKGIILTESADDTLLGMVGEVPRVEIRQYELQIRLLQPTARSGGAAA